MTKTDLLKHADAKKLATIVAKNWAKLKDEEEQEICLEAVYESLVSSAPEPENFSLMSNEAKAQHEVDVDMLLITIDFPDFRDILFDKDTVEAYFWEQVSCKDNKVNDKIYKAVFI